MPYQQSVTYQAGASGAQASLNVDPSIVPFNASVAGILGAGAAANYKLQFTFDNFDSPTKTDSSATWFDSADIPAGTATNKFSFLTSPVTRLRFNIASLSGGTLTMTILQGLSTN